MASTFIPTDNMGGGFTIVTRVIPAQPAAAGPGLYEPATAPGLSAALDRHPEHCHSSEGFAVEKFLKRKPKAIGMMHITAAVVTLLLGIVLTTEAATLSVRSLFVYWGSLIYMGAGCLSFVATINPHPCVMKGLLGMNMVSVVTAAIAVILFSLDLIYGPRNDCANEFIMCNAFKKQTNGISGVLLVFSLLQFIISICMTLFACDATCSTITLETFSGQDLNHGACCSLLSPITPYSTQGGLFVISNTSMNNPILAHPPEYSETETPGPAAAGAEWSTGEVQVEHRWSTGGV
ncbi:membrane-spanning 4-domains subfamily A member 4A-like [Brachyhypopomus gauderio]|uniref:membrane-spanning 4-domains subfamily A member 4A-like n=1 Tax=Brachyhypopomus gauderio TaxID=698409 RepID=UPI004041A7A3